MFDARRAERHVERSPQDATQGHARLTGANFCGFELNQRFATILALERVAQILERLLH